MRVTAETKRRLDRAGFTVAEALVYLVVALIVVASVYQLLIGQNRLYTKQREVQDVRATLRAAGALLATELRQASAPEGDIYSLSPYAVKLRSIRAVGHICKISGDGFTFGLTLTAGEFDGTSDDSAMVFRAGNPGSSDDTWQVGLIDPLSFTAPDSSWAWTGNCALPHEQTIFVPGLPGAGGFRVGGPLRNFRPIEYGIYLEDGRWWLGRRVGAAPSYERLAGPLRALSDSGLYFSYYDQTGAVTADPSKVSMVEFVLRGESLKKVARGVGDPDFVGDTLSIRVSLRG